MAEPWIEPVWKFGAYCGIFGGSFVGVVGGVLGGCSYLVARGQARGWIVSAYLGMLVVGGVTLATGLFALATSQPYGIWSPLLMLGATCSLVFGSLLPVILAKYREAEQRKIDAEGVRQA